MAHRKSRHTINLMVFVFIQQVSNAFHIINKCHPRIKRARLNVKGGDSTWSSERRDFLKSTVIVASSVTFLPFIATSPKVLASADSGEGSTSDSAELGFLAFSPEETATTPSISEGTLIISEPPPTRATVDVKGGRNDKKKRSADLRFFIAGGVSAAVSHGITTPIDVVKTRMQSDSKLAIISPFEAAIKIVELDGPKALLVGFGPTIIGYGIEGAMKFGVYESLKHPFLSIFTGGSSSQAFLAAAAFAGAVTSIVLCPLEETRIRLVTDPTFGNGLLDGLPRLLKEDGILSSFRRGMTPMLIKQVPYTIGKQV
ncbi:hypothetical protein ACHAXA_007649 [Cyclostephanos tholiformis]|uniref:Mitochondrial substrate carrier family protein n=1 Tax=Cyclostephanos tholiformis TaxID=382380 RepID=A0ABD3SE10_9STRA